MLICNTSFTIFSGILAPFSFVIVHATQLWSIIRPKEIIIFHLPLRPWSIDLIYMHKPNLQLHVWDDEIMQSTYLLFLHCTSAKNALKRWSIIGQNPSTILIHGDYFSINYDINNISFNPQYWCNFNHGKTMSYTIFQLIYNSLCKNCLHTSIL